MLPSAAGRSLPWCWLWEQGCVCARCCLSGWVSWWRSSGDTCDGRDQPAQPQQPVPADRQGITKDLPAFPLHRASCKPGAEFPTWGEDFWVLHPRGLGTGDPGIFTPPRVRRCSRRGLCGPNPRPAAQL